MKLVNLFPFLFVTGLLVCLMVYGTDSVLLQYFYFGVIIFCWLYLVRYLITKQKVTGDFAAKRIKRAIRWQVGLPAIAFLVIFLRDMKLENLMFVLSALIFPLLETLYWMRIKTLKPAGLVIHGDTLYFNEIQPVKRDLRTLSTIEITGESNTVRLGFEKKGDIAFAADEFAKKDLESFINLAIGKSDYAVGIPTGLKYLLNMQEHNIAG